MQTLRRGDSTREMGDQMSDEFKIKCEDPDCYVCNNYTADDFFKQGIITHGPRLELTTNNSNENISKLKIKAGGVNTVSSEETKSAREIIKDIIKSCHIMNFNNDEPMMEVAANVLIFKLTEAFEAGQRSKQLPEFTSEEINEFIKQKDCYTNERTIGFVIGFACALEQMKKKMG